MKMIVLQNKEAREKIRRELGITGAALSYALNFKRNSSTAVKARTMALQNGGVLLRIVGRGERRPSGQGVGCEG